MIRRTFLALLCAGALGAAFGATKAQAQAQAYGAVYNQNYSTQHWQRLYHYPYVYYPQNFWSSEYYQSSDDLYYRYPPEMRVPVYNKQWHNMYPEGALYHRGHHMMLDTF